MKGIRAAAVSAVLAVGAVAQVASQPQASQPIHRAVNEVMVDMVVTGAHGRIINHLKPSQIELFDNGRRRAITSFRRVSRSVHLPETTLRRFGLGRLPRDQRPQPFNLIFLVFGHVTSLGRSLARQSALWFLQHEFVAGDYGAVLDASAGLRALTPITTNRAVLERAVEQVSGGSSAGRQNVLTAEQAIYHGAGGPAQAMPEAERTQSARFGATYPAGGTGAAAAAGASALGSAAMQAALAAVINHSAAAANAASSWSSLTALRALDRALGRLRGRKEVLYYTQWLDVNPTTVFLFRAVMHDANRYHVSFYPVDPAGLTPTSSNDQVANALLRAGQAASMTAGSYYHTAAGNIENVAYAGRLSSLRELAAATGGFVAARTNDLNPFMTKIADDIHDHYELTYNPGRLGATGAFHTITIKIPGHPHWRVRARKGYYVLPRLPSPLPDRLDPLVAALYARQPPRDLGMATRAFVFPRAAGGSHLWLAAQVPLGDLPAGPLPPAMLKQHPQFRGRQLVQFALLGAVEDRRQRIVADAGKEFGFAVAAAQQAHATVPLGPAIGRCLRAPTPFARYCISRRCAKRRSWLFPSSSAPLRCGSAPWRWCRACVRRRHRPPPRIPGAISTPKSSLTCPACSPPARILSGQWAFISSRPCRPAQRAPPCAYDLPAPARSSSAPRRFRCPNRTARGGSASWLMCQSASSRPALTPPR